ncbi:MAG TPA: hypothetical protein VHF25_03065 [Nitriliruptorales bacterium]|nr:hypothetical protein [Nitriliruptorales bacterium]
MIGERLRDLSVATQDGGRVRLGGNQRDATILLLPHDDCDPCGELVTSTQDRADDIRWWGARIVTAQPDQRLREVFDLGPDTAAAGIVDRYGTVWRVDTADRDDHDPLPDAGEIEEWAKFLGTQCPECGVPDQPDTGQWPVL